MLVLPEGEGLLTNEIPTRRSSRLGFRRITNRTYIRRQKKIQLRLNRMPKRMYTPLRPIVSAESGMRRPGTGSRASISRENIKTEDCEYRRLGGRSRRGRPL